MGAVPLEEEEKRSVIGFASNVFFARSIEIFIRLLEEEEEGANDDR